MTAPRNILFLMADQLRFDYLGCAGHPFLRTPNIDALAARGVRFTSAFAQAAVCGPSRMSFYTGRYVQSHGATYNNYPLRPDELTLGDCLAPLGLRTAVAGKTHMKADDTTIRRMGLDPATGRGRIIAECGFEPFDRDDGLHRLAPYVPDVQYETWLRERGYRGTNLWHEIANSVQRDDGADPSGWLMRNAGFAARVAEADSETAYMTRRAMDFIAGAGEQPWCLHLSWIKPHWPYVAPAPYHALYGRDHVLPGNRGEGTGPAHPVLDAFRQHPESIEFRRDICRDTVIPTYMGLIAQIDDHLGRLMEFLDRTGRLKDTLIVFTSDHGDYLGDHGLGEKELFFEEALKLPLIVVDPSSAADGTRGTTVDALVEAIDLVPTFLDVLGAPPVPHRLEGRSLQPFLHGAEPGDWRDDVFAECDYSLRHARRTLGLAPAEARAWMIRDRRWKFILHERFSPELYDLDSDPAEQVDLGTDPGHAGVREQMATRLFAWLRQRRNRVGVSDDWIEQSTGKAWERGYLFGKW